MALDILGAVVPGPWPPPSSSPRSADGPPEWVLPPEGDGKLPTAGALSCFSPCAKTDEVDPQQLLCPALPLPSPW